MSTLCSFFFWKPLPNFLVPLEDPPSLVRRPVQTSSSRRIPMCHTPKFAHTISLIRIQINTQSSKTHSPKQSSETRVRIIQRKISKSMAQYISQHPQAKLQAPVHRIVQSTAQTINNRLVNLKVKLW